MSRSALPSLPYLGSSDEERQYEVAPDEKKRVPSKPDAAARSRPVTTAAYPMAKTLSTKKPHQYLESEDEPVSKQADCPTHSIERASKKRPTPVSIHPHSDTAITAVAAYSRKRKQPIAPAPSKKHSAYELFGTDSEEEEETNDVPVREPAPKKPRQSQAQTPSTHHFRKTSAWELFGSDSDDEQPPKARGKKIPTISSNFISRQSDVEKDGRTK